jgi:hypothetical protein
LEELQESIAPVAPTSPILYAFLVAGRDLFRMCYIPADFVAITFNRRIDKYIIIIPGICNII